MLGRGERVDHRHRRPLGPRLELLVRVRSDGERVDVARQRARRVGQRLAARELQLVGAQRDRRAAEVRHRDRERDARPRRVLREVEAEGRSRARVGGAAPPSARRATSRICSASVRERGRRCAGGRALRVRRGRAHDQRSLAPATASPTSPSRSPGSGASNVPARTCAATCSCASRNGTPSARAPRRHPSRAAADRRRRQRAGRGRTRDRRRASSAPRARRRRRARARTPAACPPAGRGRTRAAGLDGREQADDEPADRGAGFAACELGDVGVELLRHDRRAGRGVLRETREAELARRPEHELLADPREVREQHRGSRRGSRARSRGRRPRRSSCASRSAAAGSAGSSRRAHPRRAATAPPARLRTRSARGRARASRPRRAGGGRASPAARAAGACNRASAVRRLVRCTVEHRVREARQRRLGLARRRR